jgi:hypothetical protein
MFINLLKKKFITQHVDFPTWVRGLDTPLFIDLVITEKPIINEVKEYEPLTWSDHSVLLIEATIGHSDKVNFNKQIFNTGDFDSFRSFMSCFKMSLNYVKII